MRAQCGSGTGTDTGSGSGSGSGKLANVFHCCAHSLTGARIAQKTSRTQGRLVKCDLGRQRFPRRPPLYFQPAPPHMKHVLPAVLAAAGIALSTACQAAALDAPLTCNESAHQFIADLARAQLIDPTPTRVESNSINAFSPARGADLSAFGFHVFAVVGYEKNDPIFRTGDGAPIANSAYGAVVFGSDSSVQAAVTQAGSTAIVHHVAPHITAIFCKRS
jgi:hypothetical protein